MFEMDGNGATCLHYAVGGGSLPVMRYLVDQCGFDLSLKTAVSCRVVHDMCDSIEAHCYGFQMISSDNEQSRSRSTGGIIAKCTTFQL